MPQNKAILLVPVRKRPELLIFRAQGVRQHCVFLRGGDSWRSGWMEWNPPEAVGERMFALHAVAGLVLLAAGGKLLLVNSAYFISISGSGAPHSLWLGTCFCCVWKHICKNPN